MSLINGGHVNRTRITSFFLLESAADTQNPSHCKLFCFCNRIDDFPRRKWGFSNFPPWFSAVGCWPHCHSFTLEALNRSIHRGNVNHRPKRPWCWEGMGLRSHRFRMVSPSKCLKQCSWDWIGSGVLKMEDNTLHKTMSIHGSLLGLSYFTVIKLVHPQPLTKCHV